MDPIHPEPPPLPTPPPPRFSLPKAAWIVWGAVAALRLALALLAKAPLSPYSWGEVTGEIVGLLLLPTLVAWVVWRLAGRKAGAGHIAFFIVFALLVAGQLAQFSRRAETARMLNGMTEEARRLRSSADQDPAKATAFLESTSSKLGAATAGAAGEERAYLAAAQAFTGQLAARARDYGTASSNLGLETFFDLTRLDTLEKIATRRDLLEKLRLASASLRELQLNGEAAFRAELEKSRTGSAMIEQVLAGYRRSAQAQLPLLSKLRTLEVEYMGMMREFLDFAAAQLGQWQVEDSRLLFTEDAALEHYNTLIARLAENEKAQQAIQQQVQQAAAAKS